MIRLVELTYADQGPCDLLVGVAMALRETGGVPSQRCFSSGRFACFPPLRCRMMSLCHKEGEGHGRILPLSFRSYEVWKLRSSAHRETTLHLSVPTSQLRSFIASIFLRRSGLGTFSPRRRPATSRSCELRQAPLQLLPVIGCAVDSQNDLRLLACLHALVEFAEYGCHGIAEIGLQSRARAGPWCCSWHTSSPSRSGRPAA